MKVNVWAIVVVMVLAIIAITLEVNFQISEIEPDKIKGIAWTSDNDGALSGLDADTIDNLDSDQFIRNDQSGMIDGDLEIKGNLTHGIITKYYSVPACAFKPWKQDVEYLLTSHLINKDPNYKEERFSAPVYLPDGAIIKGFKVYYQSNHESADGDIALYGYTGITTSFRYNVSLPGNHTIYDSPIIFENINKVVTNEDTAYYFYLYLDPYALNLNIEFGLVTIEYTISSL